MGKNKLKKFAEMETFHNVFQPPYDPELAGHWRDRYFHNENPVVLELGCGRGEYTVGLAERYPEISKARVCGREPKRRRSRN